jgi:hypothetical protein
MGAPNCTLLNRYILIIGIGGKYWWQNSILGARRRKKCMMTLMVELW